MADFFSAVSSALPKATRVLAFRGTEALSALYQFEIYLLIEETGFDMSAALGADATLSINREDGQPVLFHRSSPVSRRSAISLAAPSIAPSSSRDSGISR